MRACTGPISPVPSISILATVVNWLLAETALRMFLIQ